MPDAGSPPDRGQGEIEADDAVDAVPVDSQELRPGNLRRLEAVLQQTRYVSQLPPPDDLERYERLLPGSAERLLGAGEREQHHRHEIENRAAALDEDAMPKFYAGQRRGQVISAVVALGYEAIMAVAVLEGYPIEGIVGAAIGIGAMIWAMRRDPDASESSDDDEAAQPGDATD